MGLLEDDKEYIESIKETHSWASTSFSRNLFVSLIPTYNLTRPNNVWKETCNLLSNDLHHKCLKHLKCKGITFFLCYMYKFLNLNN